MPPMSSAGLNWIALVMDRPQRELLIETVTEPLKIVPLMTLDTEHEAMSEQTRFKVGNSAWKTRKSSGRKPAFACPDVLEATCERYFEWCERNPMYRIELVKYEGKGTLYSVPTMRPFTLAGLCNFLGISLTTWANYRKKPDFIGVTERISSIISAQQFEGAAVGIFNANIIARCLGLTARRNAVSYADRDKALAVHIYTTTGA